jgi:hypothetical protein
MVASGARAGPRAWADWAPARDGAGRGAGTAVAAVAPKAAVATRAAATAMRVEGILILTSVCGRCC